MTYSNPELQRISDLEVLSFDVEGMARRASALGCKVSADRLMAVANHISSEASFLWDNRSGAPIDLTKTPEGVRA